MSVDNLENIIVDIQKGELSYKEIMEKHSLSQYMYYKILKEYGIKTAKRYNPGTITRKNTKFKRMIGEAPSISSENIEVFDKESFEKDCKEGMLIVDLMQKYSLSLYQIRELRKKLDLKTR
jgi:Mor family transcriptional regulator